MINAYYRFYGDRPQYHETALRECKSDPSFLIDLSEEEAHFGKQIFDYFVDSILEPYAYEKADNNDEYYKQNKDITLTLIDLYGEEVECLLEFGGVETWHEYENASHMFFASSKTLEAVRIKRGEGKFERVEGLTKKFEELHLTAGSSFGDGDEQYDVQLMTPELYDLLLIRDGISPKQKYDEIRAQREAERREEERAAAEEEAIEKEREEGIAESEDEKYYDKKYGVVTTLRSISRRKRIKKR